MIVLGVYGWALLSTDRSTIARALVWMGSDVGDQQRFPAWPGRDPTHTYYGTDLRKVALKGTQIERRPGEQWHYSDRTLSAGALSSKSIAAVIVRCRHVISARRALFDVAGVAERVEQLAGGEDVEAGAGEVLVLGPDG